MKHREICECVFCHLHCPACESTDLEVEFKPVMRFVNDIENELSINWEESEIEVTCQDCGDFLQHGEWGEDPRLAGLAAGIGDAIGLGHLLSVKISEEGEVTHSAFNFVPAEKVAA